MGKGREGGEPWGKGGCGGKRKGDGEKEVEGRGRRDGKGGLLF